MVIRKNSKNNNSNSGKGKRKRESEVRQVRQAGPLEPIVVDEDTTDVEDAEDAEDIEDVEQIDDEEIETQALVPVSTAADVDDALPPVPLSERDPLKIYLREISRYKLLSTEQELALTKALAETGDIAIARQLVEANLRLVVKIAMEYRHAYQNMMDLIQEGNIGLMKAVSKFSPDKGAKLSYYASWWIRSYILKFILDNFRLVRIGTTREQKKLFYNLLREKERLAQMGIRPEAKLISENLGVSEKAVVVMDRHMGSSELSLDRQHHDDDGGNGTSLLDTLASSDSSLEDQLDREVQLDILKKHLQDFVADLKERDRLIFEKRLLSEIPESLQSIADEYGVSRERIRQVEERLIQKLKVYMSEFIR